ncbi:MAG: hypothetical protein CVV40_00310, partial [Planctomycetes bacterium HGW-Planctomycetes-2]
MFPHEKACGQGPTRAPRRSAARTVARAIMLGVCAVGCMAWGGVGCVVEPGAPTSRGVPYRPAPSERAPPRGARSAPARPPDGPIATPATGAASVTTSVRVEVLPLGVVPFDGQTLPIVSPDGRFLAVQIGEAPAWPTILAAPGAAIPLAARIEIYSLAGAAPKRIEPATPLTPGLILTRACDDGGFLVEAPRPDGSRWIGRIPWTGDGV